MRLQWLTDRQSVLLRAVYPKPNDNFAYWFTKAGKPSEQGGSEKLSAEAKLGTYLWHPDHVAGGDPAKKRLRPLAEEVIKGVLDAPMLARGALGVFTDALKEAGEEEEAAEIERWVLGMRFYGRGAYGNVFLLQRLRQEWEEEQVTRRVERPPDMDIDLDQEIEHVWRLAEATKPSRYTAFGQEMARLEQAGIVSEVTEGETALRAEGALAQFFELLRRFPGSEFALGPERMAHKIAERGPMATKVRVLGRMYASYVKIREAEGEKTNA